MTSVQAICEIVEDALGLTPGTVRADDSGETLAEWDSLRHLDVVLAVEQRFGVSLSPDDIANSRTVAALAQLVERHGGA